MTKKKDVWEQKYNELFCMTETYIRKVHELTKENRRLMKANARMAETIKDIHEYEALQEFAYTSLDGMDFPLAERVSICYHRYVNKEKDDE